MRNPLPKKEMELLRRAVEQQVQWGNLKPPETRCKGLLGECINCIWPDCEKDCSHD